VNRRSFLGAAAASIFAPKFGSWYRQRSGLIVPEFVGEITFALPRSAGVASRAESDYLPIPTTHVEFHKAKVHLVKKGLSIRESHRRLGIALPDFEGVHPRVRDRLLDSVPVIVRGNRASS